MPLISAFSEVGTVFLVIVILCIDNGTDIPNILCYSLGRADISHP